MSAVLLQLVLGEEDVEQLLVGLFVGCLDPDLQLRYVQVVLLRLEGCLQTHIQDPIMLITTPSNKVHSLAGLQDLIG